jgi:hypothetical protein
LQATKRAPTYLESRQVPFVFVYQLSKKHFTVLVLVLFLCNRVNTGCTCSIYCDNKIFLDGMWGRSTTYWFGHADHYPSRAEDTVNS